MKTSTYITVKGNGCFHFFTYGGCGEKFNLYSNFNDKLIDFMVKDRYTRMHLTSKKSKLIWCKLTQENNINMFPFIHRLNNV